MRNLLAILVAAGMLASAGFPAYAYDANTREEQTREDDKARDDMIVSDPQQFEPACSSKCD